MVDMLGEHNKIVRKVATFGHKLKASACESVLTFLSGDLTHNGKYHKNADQNEDGCGELLF